jgi:hypothetical protein
VKKLLALATLVCFAASCSSPSVKNAEKVLIDCAKTDISQQVSTLSGVEMLLAEVVGVFTAGSAGWESALESIGKQVGSDALACAVKAAQSLLTAHADGSPSTSANPAAARATAFLAAHPDWQFAQ